MRIVCLLLVLGICGLAYSQQTKAINIAVLELDGNGIAAGDLGGLSNRLRMELVNTGKFSVIERSKMEEILKEQGFQQTGCTNTECAVQIGQLIGVRKIVVGSIDKVAELYSVNIRMVDVATGKIETNVAEDCEACGLTDVMKVTIHNAARLFSGLPADLTVAKKAPVASIGAGETPPATSTVAPWLAAGIPDSYWQNYKASGMSSFSDWASHKKVVCYCWGFPLDAIGWVFTIAPFVEAHSGQKSWGASNTAQLLVGLTSHVFSVALIAKGIKYSRLSEKGLALQ
ncbi:MAG: CsgG/HfaB family protein [Chitinivibrionales bacterium]|nr:CsgG/HfaB family protein [Chitinivibrionales bacterium]